MSKIDCLAVDWWQIIWMCFGCIHSNCALQLIQKASECLEKSDSQNKIAMEVFLWNS